MAWIRLAFFVMCACRGLRDESKHCIPARTVSQDVPVDQILTLNSIQHKIN